MVSMVLDQRETSSSFLSRIHEIVHKDWQDKGQGRSQFEEELRLRTQEVGLQLDFEMYGLDQSELQYNCLSVLDQAVDETS